jgi:hypothetical protein
MFDEIGCTDVGCIWVDNLLFPFGAFSLFIIMECPFLSHLINVSLKSNLSDTSFATPACFWEPLA